ncbi:MAG: hypothetical protein ACRDRW_05070 [Pseudonocardiaceae bacterium]
MSEPLPPDALFGTDGTESPDPSGRAGWRDAPGLPPLSLPTIPDPSMTREAIAATLSANFVGPVDQDPAAAPAQHPAAAPSATPTPDTQTHVTAPLPITSAPHAGEPPPAGSRFLPPLATGSRTPAQLGDFRHRIIRQALRLPLPTSADGGAAIFFLLSAIICGVLAYSVVTGIVDSIVRLFQ